MMTTYSRVLCITLVCPFLIGLSGACQPAPISTPSISKDPTSPPLLYIADNQLFQRQADNTTRMVASLGEEGEVFSAIRVKEAIFVLRKNGLQRVEIGSGKVEMVVKFDGTPLFGALVRTSNDRVVLYSTALESGCSPTGIGAKVGLYQVDKNISRDVYSSDTRYILPMGLTADRQNLYGRPVGCDPEFDRFWLISTGNGEIKKELPTWDATPKEYGSGYAALSPDSRHLAFTTSSVADTENGVIRHRLSIYNLDRMTIERYDLPHPPSHGRSLLWSSDSQWLYFTLNPGTPFDEPSNSYGLWSLNIQTGQYLRITDLDDPLMHLVSISPDGQWIFLQPETRQRVIYVHLSTAEKIFINLPPEGVDHIVP